MGLLNRAVIAAVLLSGCSSARTGIGYREVSGDHRVYYVDRMIPFARVQANQELERDIECYVRGDFSCGKVDAAPEFLCGNADGHFESFGTGISYFPMKNFSFDFGGEIFYAGFDMNFDNGRIKMATPDSVWGWGLNLGATFEKPISKNGFLFISGGYNLSDNESERCNSDFSGAYGVVGIGIRF